MMKKNVIIFMAINILLIIGAKYAIAEGVSSETSFAEDQAKRSYAGQTVPGLNISFATSTLAKKAVLKTSIIKDGLEMPWKYKRVSEIFQYDFQDKAVLATSAAFNLDIYYDKRDTGFKRAYFYDKNQKSWRELPSRDFIREGFVRARISFPFARVAVFSDPAIPMLGKSSWYGSKKGLYAASPDFPKGSRVRVYNISNGKFVDVDITDYGPDRKVHPERVLDLSKESFARLAPLGAGIITTRIILLEQGKNKLSDAQVSTASNGNKKDFETKIPSAALIDMQTGKVIWSKNATSSRPLASLSKMAAAKVFMDTKPDLEKVVEYKKQDEKLNYQYVDYEWQSARLKVKEGETMKIKDLLYSALVGSANNAVESLVRVSGLSREDFIAKMNEFAASVGATSTRFVEPTGLSPNNFSSALDYAIITREVLKNPVIKKVSAAKDYVFATVNTKDKHTIRNTNHLIRDGKMNITGSKTGYLDEAGYCLMSTVESKSKKLVAVTFGAPTRAMSFADTAELLNYGLKY